MPLTFHQNSALLAPHILSHPDAAGFIAESEDSIFT
jgi:hypothetical protein